MKKIFALALSLMMLCSCTTVMAEEVETEEIGVMAYYFDEAIISDLEGEFMALEEFGLQFFVPSDFVAMEPNEADVAKGVISVLGREDGGAALSISHAGMADANGNLITNIVDLAAFYEEQGVASVELAFNNDLECIIYTINEPSPYMGVAYITGMDSVLAFNIMTADLEDEEYATITAAVISSIMPLETEEVVAE